MPGWDICDSSVVFISWPLCLHQPPLCLSPFLPASRSAAQETFLWVWSSASIFFPRPAYALSTVCVLCSVVSSSLQPQGLQPARLLCPRGFSRQEYWSGLPCPAPKDLPNPGVEPVSPVAHAPQVDSLPLSLRASHRLHNYQVNLKTTL